MGTGGGHGDAAAVRTAGEAARMVWEESRRLWGIGTPIAIATLSLFAVSSVTTVFVGHLGNLPLAAASIGLSVFSTFSFGLSLESAVMLCLEIWYIGMITVLTGHLQDAQIAVDSLGICMNVNGWEGMIFIGLNAAISVRVSNELGSGRPRAAKHAVMVVVGESLLIGLLCMALVLIFRDSFSIIYTTDSELQHAVSRIAGLLGLTMGIWAGMLCGIALQTLILIFIVWRTDWNAEAALASSRVRKWGGADVTKPLLE
ncbi:Protein TRANSPARENT TESTA 12 [Triticum urartu]|uniref:Protein TRANSPARENT TESTA 12 n=1 Tax=Triticum urartu TaxID=4572 RepID=M8A605_TRIUA|nr:Protein TRANSPARENT TESTA 12 [Triticum urartu]